MHTGYWKITPWKRIPVYLHWTVLLWLPIYWLQTNSLLWALIAFPAFLLILLVHEYGHALAARSRGLHVIEISVTAIHGQCSFDAPARERDHIFIAWGGVLAQFVLFLFALALEFALLYTLPVAYAYLFPALIVLTRYNLVLIAINLIPLHPLDGAIAWRGAGPFWDNLKARLSRKNGGNNVISFQKRKQEKEKAKKAAEELLDRIRKK